MIGRRLGCAVSQAASGSAAYQYYQHGTMVWRADRDRIYVLYNNGTFSSFPDSSPAGWRESDLIKGGFGYLWRNNPAVQQGLGQPQVIEMNAQALWPRTISVA